MKFRYYISIMLFAWMLLFASCGNTEEPKQPLPTLAPTNEPTATVAPMKSPTPTDIPTQSPVPIREVPERQPADRSTPMPTVTSASAPTSTCTPALTSTPIPTPIPENYGEDIFVFEREYTDEWAWIEVCFWIKDKDGNPLPGKWCELLVDQEYVMIKSPLVVDYYDIRQDAVTDEEGKVEFILLEQREDGDRELNLTVTTLDSRHTEKIYCVDPVKTVPVKPEVTVEQKKEYIKLSWERDYDARKYYVERKVNNGEYELVEKWYTAHNGDYIDYDVKSGNTYYYRVYGGNHVGAGEVCEVSVVFVRGEAEGGVRGKILLD